MFKYLLLKTIYKLSDVDVVEHSRYDMSFKYFLEMAPEEDIIILRIRSSMLCKAVLDIDGDFTFPSVDDNGNLAHELEYCRQFWAQVQSDEVLSSYPMVKEKLNYLLEAMADACDHYTLSHDKNARLGHKTATKRFFEYKTHLAMSQERIITATIVTSGEKDDGKQMRQLLEENIRNDIKVETVIGDKAYCNRPNLKICNKENIELIAQLHPNVMGTHNANNGFTFNKDTGMYVCPVGHMSYQRAKHGKKEKNSNQYYVYYFNIKKMQNLQSKGRML